MKRNVVSNHRQGEAVGKKLMCAAENGLWFLEGFALLIVVVVVIVIVIVAVGIVVAFFETR